MGVSVCWGGGHRPSCSLCPPCRSSSHMLTAFKMLGGREKSTLFFVSSLEFKGSLSDFSAHITFISFIS